MTTTIADVRSAMADAIKSGTGVNCAPYVEDAINTPCAHVNRAAMDPRMVLGGSKSAYLFRVTLYVSRQSRRAAQEFIDTACATTGAGSFVAAIENGDLWPVSIDYASVTQIGDTEDRDIDGVTYAAVDFDVEVVW